MPVYQTPGVYYDRLDVSAPATSAIRTDIAGFVGIASRGPLDRPVPVESWRQFQAYFGDCTGAGYLAYAVHAFFENGGVRCWVVRVASPIAQTAEFIVQGPSPARHDIWRIAAFSPGVWGNDLDIVIRETHRAQTLTDPSSSATEYSVVAATSGFTRGTHVRLSQDGSPTAAWKVVSDIDPFEKRLLWIHPKPEARLPYDAALTGFDMNRPVLIESVEYTLLVRELGILIRVYEGLSLVPEHPRYGPGILGAEHVSTQSGLSKVLPAAPEPIVIQELRNLQALPMTGVEPLATSQNIAMQGGADGLALLGVYDFIGEDVDPLESDEVKARKIRGLRALEAVSEVSIVAVPDIHIQPIATPRKAPLPPCIPDPCLPAALPPPAIHRIPAIGDLPPVFSEGEIYQVQSALVLQCEKRRDRIALIDPPYAASRNDKLGVGAVRAWRSRFDSKYAAFYYPWLKVVDPLRSVRALTRDIPPSGHVAGQYALADFRVGVHKAPANEPLVWTQDVTVDMNEAVHGLLNSVGINAIRPLAGRGIRVFGARTVSSDPDWQFVNVGRLLMMIEKAIDLSIQWSVFEPNNVLTRAKLQLTLTSFLLALWQKGALMGASAHEAFFVKCDEENNPASERDNGRLLVEIGVAPSKPFEFVILRVGRAHNAFEITDEASASSRRGVL